MRTFSLLLLTLIGLAFLGCGDNASGEDQQIFTPIIEGRKVYISGFYQDSTLDQMVACYWLDGIRVDLEYGAAEDITVQNGDVYVAGQWFDATGWNGEACYWINGIRYDLQGGENPDVEVTGIAVDNGDVYVSGVRSDGSMFGTNACYWKNGVRTDLTGSNIDAMANSIGINNGDVYVTGWRIQNHASIACYWKNGNINNVSRNSSFGNSWGATAFGIFLDGNDVYLAGYNAIANKFDIGCKWKNGNLHELSGSTANEQQTWLYDIAVANDVKITVGFYYTFIEDENDPLYYDSPIFACYYRNGQRVNLEESEWQVGEATGVFIE